jgi:hypothetical protein
MRDYPAWNMPRDGLNQWILRAHNLSLGRWLMENSVPSAFFSSPKMMMEAAIK